MTGQVVITKLNKNDYWWYLQNHKKYADVNIIKLTFYKPDLKKVCWFPRDLYLDTQNRKYDFDGIKAKSFGVVKGQNLGSFNELFLESKLTEVKDLLEKNNWNVNINI